MRWLLGKGSIVLLGLQPCASGLLDSSHILARVKSLGRSGPVPLNGSSLDQQLDGGGLHARQEEGRCGPDFGNQVCPGQECCSMYGWCGDGSEYCNEFGCRVDFGWCEGQPVRPTTTAAPPPPPPPPPTTTSSTARTTTSAQPQPTNVSPVPGTDLEISADGMCGNGTTCAGSGFGQCCSFWYYCGDADSYCGDNCREEWGECEGDGSTPEPTDLVISEDGFCGNGTTCAGSGFGGCCSLWYYCGSDGDYCGDGCRSDWGYCGDEIPEEPSETETPPEPSETEEPQESTTSQEPSETEEPEEPSETEEPEEPSETEQPPAPTQTDLVLSDTGTCGNGTTCMGSGYGDCCSLWYYCGTTDQYCGDGCRPEFGECGETEPSPPEPSVLVSMDGICGNGTTCAGSTYGDCCSFWFWCGEGEEYCGNDCRSEYGLCE